MRSRLRAVYAAYHQFETKYFERHVQADQDLLDMVKDRDVNGVTAYFRNDSHTGDMKNGRRGLGSMTIQEQASFHASYRSCIFTLDGCADG